MGKFSSVWRVRPSTKAVMLSFLIGLTAFSAVKADESFKQSAEPVMSEISVGGDSDASDAEQSSEAAVSDISSETKILDLESAKLRPAKSKRRISEQDTALPSSLESAHKLVGDAAAVRYKPGVPCVPLMLVDDPGTLIVCDRDASIKAEKRVVSLTRGKGVFMVGKHPVVVETQLGSVTLPGNSAAIIEQRDDGFLRVDHLTGEPSSVAVKRWIGATAFKASYGDEICLAPKSFSAKDVASTDGVDRRQVSSETGQDGISLASNKFAPKDMLDKECLLQCDSNSFFQVRRKVYQLRKTIDEQELASSKNHAESEDEMPVFIVSADGDVEVQPTTPVTFEEPIDTPLALQTKHTSSALVKFNSKTNIGFDHPSVTELRDGEALVLASELSFVKTPNSMLKIEPGTLVLVSVNDGVTKVRNLWEDRRNGVCQTVDSTPFYVVAGDETLVGDDLRSVYLSASKDMVGRRLAHVSELGDGRVVHSSEVSLMSLAQSTDLLSQLTNSNDPVDKALAKKLNKMAAILVQITSSHGLYMLMQAPQWRHDSKSSTIQGTI